MDLDNIIGTPEARSVAFNDLEVTKSGRKFDGYAAIYGEETDLGANLEVILPPAFRSGLANTPNLPMLWDHNASMPPFATTGAGTLEVTEDRRGLRVRAEIDERHILGPTMMSMAERGELRGMSFGFVTGPRDNKISERGGRLVRAITGFKRLLDVSPTWDPAYAGTSAELRSLTAALQGASALDDTEQVPEAEPEEQGDGPVQQAADEQDATVDETVVEQSDSGADALRARHAARRRRLQMMGLTLPETLR